VKVGGQYNDNTVTGGFGDTPSIETLIFVNKGNQNCNFSQQSGI